LSYPVCKFEFFDLLKSLGGDRLEFELTIWISTIRPTRAKTEQIYFPQMLGFKPGPEICKKLRAWLEATA
jgi:hypothetical protein